MTWRDKEAEWLVRILFGIGGIAATIIGSWIVSAIRVYHDNRKAHLDEKQKVLVPLAEATGEGFQRLVSHDSPVIGEQWGERGIRTNARVTEADVEEGSGLTGDAHLSQKILFSPLSPRNRVTAERTVYWATLLAFAKCKRRAARSGRPPEHWELGPLLASNTCRLRVVESLLHTFALKPAVMGSIQLSHEATLVWNAVQIWNSILG